MLPLRSTAIAATLMIPAFMSAQLDRSKVPAPGPAPVVNIGAHKSFTLNNGMRVIVVENHKLPLVSVQVRFDNPPILQGEYAGYQDLVGELLTSGTARHSKEQIDELIDGMGAELSGTSDGLYASALKKNFNALMNVVSEVITSATYPNAEFEKARTRALSGIQSRSDDPDQISDVVGRVLTYGKGYPYGEPTTEKSMGKVQRAQVFAYYQYAFNPKRGYLVLVGDITEAEARTAAERCFGFWTGANQNVTKDAKGHDVVQDLGPIIPVVDRVPQANNVRQVSFVDRPGSAQSVVRVLFPVDLKPNDPMALHAQVMNTILGGGVFNARLMQNLRENKAYTYGAYSSLDADRYCGSFSGGCSVRNAVTDSAIVELMYEIEHIQQMEVTPEELALAKNYMAGSFGRSLEDPRTIARFALNTYLNDLPADHYATYLQRLEKVTAADVQAAAQRFLKPDNAAILVVGDKAEVGNKLAPLSFSRAVVYYDINGDVYRENAELPPAGVTAETVMAAYLKAIGGKEAVAKVKDLQREYTASMQGMGLTMTESQAPGKYAMVLRTGEMVLQKTVYDGERGSAIGMEGPKELVDTELADARKNIYIFPELHYAELDQKGLVNGVLEINGRRAYRMVVNNSDGNNFTEYYDAETGLKIRRVESQSTEQGTFQVVTDYSDYKPVDGIQFPHTIRQNAGMDLSFTLQKVMVNKGVPPSVFKVD